MFEMFQTSLIPLRRQVFHSTLKCNICKHFSALMCLEKASYDMNQVFFLPVTCPLMLLSFKIRYDGAALTDFKTLLNWSFIHQNQCSVHHSPLELNKISGRIFAWMGGPWSVWHSFVSDGWKSPTIKRDMNGHMLFVALARVQWFFWSLFFRGSPSDVNSI